MKRSILLTLSLLIIALRAHAAYVCSIDPAISTNLTGDILLFTATITQDGFPVESVNISYKVLSGPNISGTDSTTTDINGEAPFAYFSDGRTGKDTIQIISSVGTTCTATSVWVDFINEPPIAFCRDVITNASLTCNVIVPATEVDDGSFDYDGDIVKRTLTPPGPYPLGVTPVTLTVIDELGALDTCNATITVVDLTPPAILCPIQIVTNLPAGISNTVVNFALPVATDNCGTITPTCEPPSGSDFPLGTTPVICTAVDGAGNTNQCAFDVILNSDPEPGHDLTIAKLKGPKAVKFSATVTQVTSVAVITVANLSDHIETITNYEGLVTLVAQSLGGGCADALVTLHNGLPNKPLPVVLLPGKKVNISFDVKFDCVNDRLKGIGHEDYRILATVNHSELGGIPDSNPVNDDCPRPPNLLTGDKGCGGKGGGAVLVDATVK